MLAFIPWLVGIISSVFVWVAANLSVQFAARITQTLFFAAIVVAFTLAIDAAIIALLYNFTPGLWVRFGMSLVPTNLSGCVSIYATVLIFNWIFQYKSRALFTTADARAVASALRTGR